MVELADVTAPSPVPLRARRALWILAVFFLMQIVVGLFVGFFVAIQSTTYGGARTAASVSVVPAAIAGLILGGLLAFRMSKRTFPHSPHELYQTIGWSRASRFQILSSALVGLALSGLYLFVAFQMFPPKAQQSWNVFGDAIVAGGWLRHGWALLALVLAPLVEEFLFRGVVFAGLARSWPVSVAGLVTTILFVLGHGVSLQPYWPSILAITSLAVVALGARIVTKSLAPCISMHAAYNLGMVVCVYAGTP
jgi:membrane protease YdiL (CAAX protease family)